MSNIDKPAKDERQPKPRKKRKYTTKEERRRQWGMRPLPPLHTKPEEESEQS